MEPIQHLRSIFYDALQFIEKTITDVDQTITKIAEEKFDPSNTPINYKNPPSLFVERKDEADIDLEMETSLEQALKANLSIMPEDSAFNDTDLIIFKDEFTGQMPINGIKKREFEKISTLLKDIQTDNTNIHISSSNVDFSNKIIDSIKLLLTREIGRELIEKILVHKTETIKIELGFQSGFSRIKSTISLDRNDINNEHLTNVIDPDIKGSKRRKYPGSQPIKAGHQPLFLILAHEMIHATHYLEDPIAMEKRSCQKIEQYTNEEEKLTIEGFSQGIYDKLNERNITAAFADKKKQIGYPRWSHKPCYKKIKINGKTIYGTLGTIVKKENIYFDKVVSVENGSLNGQGRMIFSEGAVIEGEFKNDKLVNGKGKRYDGKIIYEGEFTNSLMFTKGKMTSPLGIVAEGEFENLAFKKGKMTWPNGAIQEGEFDEDVLKQGKMTLSDGTIREGEFEDDASLVKGKILYPDGTVHIGEFKNNRLNGQGVIISPHCTAKGEFEGKMLRGKITYSDGKIFEGEFELYKSNNCGSIFTSGEKLNLADLYKKLDEAQKIKEENEKLLVLKNKAKELAKIGDFKAIDVANTIPLERERSHTLRYIFLLLAIHSDVDQALKIALSIPKEIPIPGENQLYFLIAISNVLLNEGDVDRAIEVAHMLSSEYGTGMEKDEALYRISKFLAEERDNFDKAIDVANQIALNNIREEALKVISEELRECGDSKRAIEIERMIDLK